MSHDFIPARRRILTAAAGTTVLASSAGFVRSAFAQPKEFKIGFFIALSGPASLFGPTQRACADLAAEKINKAGGIMGRPVRLIFTDAGGPPAETAKSAVRLMLEDKVDLFIGSHDSATREANIATLRAGGVVFWLRATPATIVSRIGGDNNRPSLTGTKSFTEEVEEVLARRQPLYERLAHAAIDTDSRTPEDLADTIVQRFRGGTSV